MEKKTVEKQVAKKTVTFNLFKNASRLWYALPIAILLVALGIYGNQFGFFLPVTSTNTNATTNSAPKPNAAMFFIPSEDLEVSDEPNMTWKPMEDDWNSNTTATFDQKWEQAFMVDPNGTFSFTADRGDLVIRPNELTNKIVVTVMRRVEASSKSEAKKILSNHSIKVKAIKDGLNANAKLDKEFAQNGARKTLKRVLYRVSIPRKYRTNLTLDDGDIKVGELRGDVRAKATAGRITIARITGNINVEGRGGCIDLTKGCTGNAEVLSVNADVYLANATGKSSRVRNSGGNVWLGESSGKVYAQTSGGNVKVENVGGTVSAFALDGNVSLLLGKNPGKDSRFGATNGDLEIKMRSDVAAQIQVPKGYEFEESHIEVSTESDDEEANWKLRKFNDGDVKIKAEADSGTLTLKILPMSTFDSSGGSGLGGSGLGGSGLGGSGLGGSGDGLSSSTAKRLLAASKKVSDRPAAGKFTTFPVEGENMDGYTMYLPISFDENTSSYPILVALQGSWGVGGPIESVNMWGLTRLIRDQNRTDNERNEMILDKFIVVSPHIKKGGYGKHSETVKSIVESVAKDFRGDLNRVYLTGLSRGGHGTWGLASRLPDLFAAIVPIAGNTGEIEDFEALKEPAIWIAHNRGDSSFKDSDEVAKKIEKITEKKFLRVDKPDVSETDYLDQRYVFTAPRRNHHDAWTELYVRPEVYKWLLRQRKKSKK